MSRIKELRQEKAELVAEARAILDLTRKEKREMNEAETQKAAAIDAKLTSIQNQLTAEERHMERERSVEALPSHRETEVEPAAEDARPPLRLYSSFGEQLRDVALAAQGGGVNERLVALNAASGMNEGVPSEGGFLVQTDFAQELLRVTRETGLLFRRTRKMTVGPNSNGVKINAVDETSRASTRWGGILAYWLGEGGTKTASKPKFRQIELSLRKLIGLLYASDELLDDTTALESLISTAFAEEFGFQIDDKIVRGTGAGVPLGILNSAALITVNKEAGQAAATVVKENIDKMYVRMPASSLARAEWYINQEVWQQLFKMTQSVGTGGVPVFLPAGQNLANAPFGTLYGRPITPIEHCAALGTVGDVIFADLQQYLTIEKGRMQSASSIHVKFTTDETAFRFVLRMDGQPIPNSPLTPAYGTDTLSPFVALATRA